MTSRSVSRVLLLFALVALGSACAWSTGRHFLDRLCRTTVTEHETAWRQAAEGLAADAVGIVCERVPDLTSTDRTQMIAAAWGAAPARLVPLTRAPEAHPPDVVMASAFVRPALEDSMGGLGYRVVWNSEFVDIWTRGEPVRRLGARKVPWGEELPGVLACGLLMCAALGLWLRRTGLRVAPWPSVGSAGVLLLLGGVVLAHGLVAPNGLGVYAGKAKLFLAAGGVPDGFWTDPGYAVYQPSYPPGLTLLVLAASAFGGACGEWLVQLLEAFAGALLFFVLACGGKGRAVPFAAAFVLSPVAVRLFSGFYAEPFAALALVAGWRLARRGDPCAGRVLMGAAGLFRPEGLVLAGAFASAGAFLGGARERGPRAFARALVPALAPGLLWQLFCAAVGARVYDYDFTSWPDVGRLASALAGMAAGAFAGFASGGAAVLLPAAVCTARLVRRETAAARPLLVALGAGLTSAAAGALFLAFNVSPHFGWIVGMTVPRFVWLAFAIPVAEALLPAEAAAPAGDGASAA